MTNMTDQNAIQAISGFFNDPASGTDSGATALVIEKYPYFVPARYIAAAAMPKETPVASGALRKAYSYIGNWINFYQLLNGTSPLATADTSDSIEETEPATKNYEATQPTPEPVIIEQPTIAVAQYTPEEEIKAAEDAIEYVPAPQHDTDSAAEMVEEPEIIEDITLAIETEESTRLEGEMEKMFGGESQLITAIDDHKDIDELYVPHGEIKKESNQITEELNLIVDEPVNPAEAEFFAPAYAEDYFMQQGIKIPTELPAQVEELLMHHEEIKSEAPAKEKSLMVMMSFTEWLLHFKNSADKQKSEIEAQKAIKTMWQKEKLAAAQEEEDDEIPENVFEMAVNSITKEEGLASESLADIYIKQGKYEKAIEMYRKLSLRNPQKNAYFARKIEEVLKDKQI